MSTFEQTLNAGVPVTFPGGEQFHLLEADEPVDVTFYDNRNRPIEIWESMKGGFRHTIEKGFIQVRLESATGQTVKIALTSGRGQYDRSQGDVNILNIVKDNSWYYDSLQKNAFIGSGQLPPVGSNNAMVELWNPAASGKILICTHADATINAATYIYLNHHNAALGGAGPEGNKYLNEAAGVGIIQAVNAVGLLGTNICYRNPTIDFDIIPMIKSDPVIIREGFGLIIGLLTVNLSLQACFEWTEIPA